MARLKRRSELLMHVAQRLELPEEALSGAAKLTVTAGKRLLLENHRGILEYGAERIVVNTAQGKLVISGAALRLLAINERDLLIGGGIQIVEWV